MHWHANFTDFNYVMLNILCFTRLWNVSLLVFLVCNLTLPLPCAKRTKSTLFSFKHLTRVWEKHEKINKQLSGMIKMDYIYYRNIHLIRRHFEWETNLDKMSIYLNPFILILSFGTEEMCLKEQYIHFTLDSTHQNKVYACFTQRLCCFFI